MPVDSFESPLTLAACGGHTDLALLLIERGAKIEEVNDEGYTPLMEAAREGHEEMVTLLLANGKILVKIVLMHIFLLITNVCYEVKLLNYFNLAHKKYHITETLLARITLHLHTNYKTRKYFYNCWI